MKLTFVYPAFKKYLSEYPDLYAGLRRFRAGEIHMPPSLALPILAALTPDDVEIDLVDDNIGEAPDYDADTDAVIVSFFTPQAKRAYEIADEYRRRGRRVVMGGFHPTFLPDEALEHCDAVCIGEGEPVWPRILEDLRERRLARRYVPEAPLDLARMPVPRRDIFERDKYEWGAHLVETMRGCALGCIQCSIPRKNGREFRFRPIPEVIEDVRSIPFDQIFVTDDTLFLPDERCRRYALDLFEAMSRLEREVRFFVATNCYMPTDREFLEALRRGKVESVYLAYGYEPFSLDLFGPRPPSDVWTRGIDMVRSIEDAGLHFFASFGIGLDSQDESFPDVILRFAEEAGVDLAEFYIATPYPGTPFGDRCAREGRILHRDYDRWNNSNVVFRPKNFTEGFLVDAFRRLWVEFYRGKNYKRSIRSFL